MKALLVDYCVLLCFLDVSCLLYCCHMFAVLYSSDLFNVPDLYFRSKLILSVVM